MWELEEKDWEDIGGTCDGGNGAPHEQWDRTGVQST